MICILGSPKINNIGCRHPDSAPSTCCSGKANQPMRSLVDGGGNLGFPALRRHHSATGRKDTHNGKRCGKKRTGGVMVSMAVWIRTK